MKKLPMILSLIVIVVILGSMITLPFFISHDKECDSTIEAKVVDIEEKSHTSGYRFPRTDYYYILTVEYNINDKIIRSKCGGKQSLFNKSKLNDIITVCYDSNNIEKCSLYD